MSAVKKTLSQLREILQASRDCDESLDVQSILGKVAACEAQLLLAISEHQAEILKYQRALDFERSKSLQNAKLASVGQLSAGIAHEINNPLAVIIGSVPLLHKFRNDPEKLSTRIDVVLKAGRRIDKIVKGLQKFSRSAGGTARREESIVEIVNDSLMMTEAKARRHGVSLEFDNGLSIATTHAQNARLLCDGVEIEQVVINLINNGIDAVKDLDQRWVRVSIAADSATLILRVTDSGRGIPQALEPNLFQPFFTTKPAGEGTGLGLSIAKEIVAHHGAMIGLDRSSENTCFEIRFPRALDATPALAA